MTGIEDLELRRRRRERGQMGSRSFAMAAVCFTLCWSAGRADTIRFEATLTGSGEAPANAGAGTGKATAILNTATGLFSYTVTYSGLTGPAVAAHFHGPASRTETAPPVVTLKPLASPITGEAALSDGQIGDVLGEVWYVDIHTAAHPGGEIRGQLIKAP